MSARIVPVLPTLVRHINVDALGPMLWTHDGRPCCRWCKTPIRHGMKTRRWCSVACKDEFLVRYSATIARDRVFKRDKGICATCGVDTKVEKKKWSHGWEADHIIPVSEGGGACGLENLRTLCMKCHGAESGALRKRLNAAKRAVAAPPLPGVRS